MSTTGLIPTVLPNGRRQLSRYAALESIGAFTALALSLVVPLGPLILLLAWKAPLVALAAVGVWALSGLVTLVPSWSAPLAARLIGLRDCRPDEYRRLAPLLADVARRIGLDSHRAFSLRIWPCPNSCRDGHPPYFVNACAAGANLIAVSEDCLAVLSDDEIRAILAHEIAHHSGYEPAVRILSCYYIWSLDWLLGHLGRAGRVAGSVLAAPVLLAIAVSSKPAELHADEVAARMGYGRALHRLLSRLGTNDPASIRDAVVGSHPALADRLHRIDHVLRHG